MPLQKVVAGAGDGQLEEVNPLSRVGTGRGYSRPAGGRWSALTR